MSRSLRFVSIVRKFFPLRSFFAGLTHVPVLGKVIDRVAFDRDELFYLPRNRVIELNHPLSPPEEIVLPTRVIQHFIDSAEVHWIMNTCICRESKGCRDYPITLGCLFLGEAALGIHPGLGRRVTREEASLHIQRCQEAGLVHVIGRNKLDTLWLGVGPGEKLLTICHCCPCCCLWRMIPRLSSTISRKVHRMPGIRIAVTDRCTGCGLCISTCFVRAIILENNMAKIGDECRGCGRCVQMCPEKAIDLIIEDPQYVDSSISIISEVVRINK